MTEIVFRGRAYDGPAGLMLKVVDAPHVCPPNGCCPFTRCPNSPRGAARLIVRAGPFGRREIATRREIWIRVDRLRGVAIEWAAWVEEGATAPERPDGRLFYGENVS